MPPIESRHIRVAFDMRGCPNACRHCYLGTGRAGGLTEDDVRWAVEKLRTYSKPEEGSPFVERLTVSTWFREPDYSEDYKRLYAFEGELSDERPPRHELLSVWRLARDEAYAPWARSVGTRKCQISFFGLEAARDWFSRRKGAFRDSVLATERVLDAGILPRWQFFLTRKILPDLDGLMRLIEDMRLRERAARLGSEFDFFIHPPTPDGAAEAIEHLRPTLDETTQIPAEIIEASKKHGTKTLWRTEADLYREILGREITFPYIFVPPERWFFVDSRFDVYSNIAALEPWWRLGNLKTDSVGDIFARYENNGTLGLQTIYGVSPKELARRYGNPESQLVYEVPEDLLSLWVSRFCRETWS